MLTGSCTSAEEPIARPPLDKERLAALDNLLQTDIRPTDPLSPQEQLRSFHLPEGFEIQLFASEPEIGKPLNLGFDSQGRLWVTQSWEYPFVAEEGQGRDRISILQDTTGDGRADRVTTFAEGLNVPMGIVPVRGGAVAFSIPFLYRFFDLNGDGRADEKVVLFGGFGYKDTHGLVSSLRRGFDGWIYACHGFTNESLIHSPDGTPLELESGNTFRFTASGTAVQSFTTGQVNPFGLSFDPLGHLYSADCHSRPIYQLLRGADYPHFAKTPTGLGFGPEMMDFDHGSTAISGIAYYAAHQFPPEYRDNLFTGNVMTSRINRASLRWNGSSPWAVREPDFLISEDPWFRPVDVQLGPDGALYIADFYNRIIGHYEVPLEHPDRDRERGRIWRVVYRGRDAEVPASAARGNWSTASLETLIEDLSHANLTVRMLAANEFVDRFGQAAVAPVYERLRSESVSEPQVIHGLWVLQRLRSLEPQTLLDAIDHPSPMVRVHGLRILSEMRLDDRLRERAVLALQDEDPHVRRAAAEVLRLNPNRGHLVPLLELLRETPALDTHLIYTARMALRDQFREPSVLEWAERESWSADQIPRIADVLVGVESEAAAEFLLSRLNVLADESDTLLRYAGHAARHLPERRLTALLDRSRQGLSLDLNNETRLFKTVHEGLRRRQVREPEALRAWGLRLLNRHLEDSGEKGLQRAFELAGILKWAPLAGRLETALLSRRHSDTTRAAAAEALASIGEARHVQHFGRLARNAEESGRLRGELLRMLGLYPSPLAASELSEALPAMPRSLRVRAASALLRRPEGDRLLLELVEQGKAAPYVLRNSTISMHYRSTDAELRERFLALIETLAPERDRLDALIETRVRAYDEGRASSEQGRAVFREHCAQCHQFQGEGKSVGPHLDGTAGRGLERLVEDILDPNRNVDPAFYARIFRLKSGVVLTGTVIGSDEASILLADEFGETVEIRRDEIDSETESETSPMPADFHEQISESDFNHLLSFLQAPGRSSEQVRPEPSN